jgi:hypothetical protein
MAFAGVAGALGLRFAAEYAGAAAAALHGLAGAAWVLAWLLWLTNAVPRIAVTHAPLAPEERPHP